MKRVLLAALAVVMMAGCANEESIAPEGAEGVSFTSQIGSRVSADGVTWSANERIGVTMFDVVSSTETLATDSDNIEYKSTNTEEAVAVSFVPAESDVYLIYPNSGSVKFYAYYPYQASMVAESFLFSADISDQENTDFMIASTEVTDRSNNGAEVLTFTHMLSLLTLNITGKDTASDLAGLKVSITGANTKGSYDITTGAAVGALSENATAIQLDTTETTEDGVVTGVTAKAIVLPETLAQDAVVTFTLGTRPFTMKIESETEFLATKNHTYNVSLGNDMPDFVSGATIEAWGPATNTDKDDLVPQASDIALVNEVYQIYTAKGLQEFAALVNGEAEANIAGKLMNNINLYTICSSSSALSWTPIGSETKPYNGKFDGNGKVITRLYLFDNVNGYQGLFGSLGESAEVQKLGVEGAVTGVSIVGGIAGYSEGVISSCYFIGSVSGRDTDSYVGGIVGENGGSITNCYHIGGVYGLYYIGGVAGKSSSEEASLTRCYHVGEVNVNDDNNYFDGVVAEANSNVTNCYFDLDVDGDPSPTNGLTTTAMQTELLSESYFNNTTDWAYDSKYINEGYPVLIWQVAE